MQSSRAHVAVQSPTLPCSHKHKGAVRRRRLSNSKGLENDCCLRGSDCLHRDAAEATDTAEVAGGADTANVEDTAGAADPVNPLFEIEREKMCR